MLFSLLAVLALSTGALARKQFIVGGSDVDIADYPWQGSYRTGAGSHSCGCVFVGGNFVLTAAHCGGSSSYTMEFGSTDRDSGDGTVVAVDSVLEHPDYGSGPGFSPNDIAIVTAAEEISGTNISPASIAPNGDNPGGTGWITGWGRTCGSCSLPVTLQGTEIPIIDDDLCDAERGDSFQSDNMICVWDQANQDIGACNGDSGGPLATSDGTLYGLTSWGTSGCSPTDPSVYNRVGAFNEWVCGNTNGVSGC